MQILTHNVTKVSATAHSVNGTHWVSAKLGGDEKVELTIFTRSSNYADRVAKLINAIGVDEISVIEECEGSI